MSRHLIALYSDADRARARTYVNSAPVGSRVEIKAPRRSLPQNDALWAMLTDVAQQVEHHGRKYPPATWKILFMHGWQKEITLIPSLDGKEIVPLTRSSDLSHQEMSELLAFIDAWGAQNGVTFHGPQENAA